MHHSLLIVFPGSPRRLSLISADSCQPPPSSLPFIFPLVWHWGFALFSCRLLCSNQLLLDLERRAGLEGSQYLFMYDRDELADFHFRQTNRNWFHSTSCSIVNSRRFCRHRTTGRPQNSSHLQFFPRCKTHFLSLVYYSAMASFLTSSDYKTFNCLTTTKPVSEGM